MTTRTDPDLDRVRQLTQSGEVGMVRIMCTSCVEWVEMRADEVTVHSNDGPDHLGRPYFASYFHCGESTQVGLTEWLSEMFLAYGAQEATR